jgi:hypothetical protein
LNEHLHPVLVLDDDAGDLDRVARAYPNIVTWNPAGIPAETPSDAVECAITLLKTHRPATLILDLRWHTGGTYYDGIRFLRRACEADLLEGVHLIIWSYFLTEAGRTLSTVMPALSSAGIRSVTRVTKAEIPRLESARS